MVRLRRTCAFRQCVGSHVAWFGLFNEAVGKLFESIDWFSAQRCTRSNHDSADRNIEQLCKYRIEYSAGHLVDDI